MKSLFLMLALLAASAAHGDDGILSRFSNNERTAATEIIILNGQTYTAPAGTAARIQRQQEQAHSDDAVVRAHSLPQGNFVGSDGTFYQGVAGGWVNTQNGQFVPR